ncbi:dihydrodipicolinate synthase family protein [Actomonas aquatica]|uniref:Dihydrodipicolinate synthase family protein n=1 Tax=Actomonas aquatica TaxID=2866162 RepID=A0ABZ1C994_9BACT|nr:dihydrodipicolinate synthase family protein [Opitutus sp. WL0086]WRQ88272.1 dihydrodipicolinate synthase family protein [Opitutus sp. WL0086]
MPSSLHRGVIVPMVTPATAAGDVDLAAAACIADRLAAHGLHIFVLGTTGEAASVAASQRLPLVQTTLQAAAGRVSVYVGIGDHCVAQSIEAGRAYLALGATAVVALLPGYYALTPADMTAYFRRIHDGVGGPLMLYNIPVATHHSIPLDVIAELADLPHVIGFKDSEGTAGRWEEAYQRFGDRPNFALLMGIAAKGTAALRGGFDGVIPSGGNLMPAEWAAWWRHVEAGDWDAATALQQQFDQVNAALQRGTTLGHALAGLKTGLAAQGMCSPAMLPPLSPYSDSVQAEVCAALRELQVDLG